MTNPRIVAIDRAIAAGGGIMSFAEAIGVTHQAVYSWKRRGYAPPIRAARIDALYGIPVAALIDPVLLAAVTPIYEEERAGNLVTSDEREKMKLRPLLNHNHLPSGDMLLALNWFEARCIIRGIPEVTEAEVVEYLRQDKGREDLAKAFVSDYFLPADFRYSADPFQ